MNTYEIIKKGWYFMLNRIIALEGGDGVGKKTQTSNLITNLNLYFLQKETETKHKESFPAVIRFQVPNYENESSILVRKFLAGDFPEGRGDSDVYAAALSYSLDRYLTFYSPIPEDAWEEFCDRYGIYTGNQINRQMKISYADLFNHPSKYGFDGGIIIVADRYIESNLMYQGARLIEKYAKSFEYYSKMGEEEYDRIVRAGVSHEYFLFFKEWLINLEKNLLHLPYGNDEGVHTIYLSLSEEIANRNMQSRYKGDSSKKDILEKDEFLQKCVRIVAEREIDLGEMQSIKCYSGSLMYSKEKIADMIFEYVKKEILYEL